MNEAVQEVYDELWEERCGEEFGDAANKVARHAASPSDGDIIILDGFSVVRSNRILFREVLNDAQVGPWRKVEGIHEHSIAGLREWMGRHGGWDLSKLGARNAVFDHHLVDYGLRLQFWVPMSEDIVLGGLKVVCVDATGASLTEGGEYEVVSASSEMYTVLDDDGNRTEFMKERFGPRAS